MMSNESVATDGKRVVVSYKSAEKSTLLTVVIPVYNESKTILTVIDRVLSLDLDLDVIVVDDGSTDGTRELLANFESDRVQVVLQEVNMGKGAAVRTGFSLAGGEIVTIQDADLELNPLEIPALLEPILEGSADVVYGSRFMRGWHHRTRTNAAANRFLSWLTNVLYGTRIKDMEACYKVFRRQHLKRFTLKSNRFDFEPEITAKLVKLGLKIVELPITYRPRDFTDGKKIHWKDGFQAIYALFKYRFVD
ncbi:MAG: glycosyltransferase family 2 protein [Candidatus Latescibacterota bacterium]|jgi:glycosyltransferase involved in cell wall biosynthesis